MEGALILNKPAGMTSHDVVSRVRRLANERSIGHLGTLDPSATGVLPLLLGRLTRLAQYFQLRDKEYRGTVRFGFATDTYDAAGTPVGEPSPGRPSREQLEAALARFRGRLEQTPPPFSAKKIGGVPAYKLARKKEPVALTPVAVEIAEIELEDYDGETARFRAVCSPGTYMRSLAHDLGQALGMGAHLVSLERTRVGEFTLAASHTLGELEQLAQGGRSPGGLGGALLPASQLLTELPAVVAPPEAAARLRHGMAANLPEFSRAPLVRVFTPEGQLLALARRVAGSLFQPQAVFAG